MTFGNAARAAAQLRAILPRKVAQAIELQSLELVESSFVDRNLRRRHSDLLFRAKINGKRAYLYLLYEHRSEPDGLMAFRLLGYVVRILERHIEEAGSAAAALPLPIVIPIVLHHGASGWRGATSTLELFDQELVERTGAGPFVPQMSFVLDDLMGLSNEALAARNLDDLSALALWSMRDARTARRLLISLKFWAPRLERLAQKDAEALEHILRYLWLVVPDADLDSFLSALHTAAPATEPLTMTIAEQLEARGIAKGRAEGRAEGKAEGKAEGRAEGKAEGRAEGLRRALTHLLTLKFGVIDSVSARIEHAREEQLLFWSERVLSAASLAEVFEDR
jgi:predicted transposase/invertase (TIGR01784 family)